MFSTDFWLLILSVILVIIFLIYLMTRKKRTQLHAIFITDFILTLIISIGVLLQSVFKDIDPIVFENFIYIGTCFLPVSIFFTGSIFVKTKIHLKRKHLLLFIIPITSLLILWTNKYHNLFYVTY